VVQEIADQLLSQPEREKRLDAFCESASKGEYTAGHVDYILTDLAIEAIRAGLERGRALGARGACGDSADMFSPLSIGERLRVQDDRSTANPIFVVQKKLRIYGMDPDYATNDDDIVWVHCDGPEADADERAELERKFDETGDVPEEWHRTGFLDTWEFVSAFFTEAAAQRYIDENKHNLKEPRVYVESGYRNKEWEVARGLLTANARRSGGQGK
jgi:hypothetical protein